MAKCEKSSYLSLQTRISFARVVSAISVSFRYFPVATRSNCTLSLLTFFSSSSPNESSLLDMIPFNLKRRLTKSVPLSGNDCSVCACVQSSRIPRNFFRSNLLKCLLVFCRVPGVVRNELSAQPVWNVARVPPLSHGSGSDCWCWDYEARAAAASWARISPSPPRNRKTSLPRDLSMHEWLRAAPIVH